jgi:acetate kinase
VVRYGFHGLAFQSAWRQLQAQAPDLARQRLVMAHLGGGSSLCAVHDGRSLDTTMGLTPLDGVPMATRSGSLDPGVVGYLAQSLRMPWPQIEQVLWRESGLKGISGLSGDMRELLADPGEAAALARQQFAMRVAQAIAAMATSLGGVDAIVFSGGIGAGAAPIRAQIAASLRWMGVVLDPTANRHGGPVVHAGDASVGTWVFQVDEEFELLHAALALETP